MVFKVIPYSIDWTHVDLNILTQSFCVCVCVSTCVCMCVCLLQGWSCEDSDVHQPLPVCVWCLCGVYWKLLLFCRDPLPPRHGESLRFGVFVHFCVVCSCRGCYHRVQEKLQTHVEKHETQREKNVRKPVWTITLTAMLNLVKYLHKKRILPRQSLVVTEHSLWHYVAYCKYRNVCFPFCYVT